MIGADASFIICWIVSSDTSIPIVLNVPRKSLAQINPSLFKSNRLKHWVGRFWDLAALTFRNYSFHFSHLLQFVQLDFIQILNVSRVIRVHFLWRAISLSWSCKLPHFIQFHFHLLAWFHSLVTLLSQSSTYKSTWFFNNLITANGRYVFSEAALYIALASLVFHLWHGEMFRKNVFPSSINIASSSSSFFLQSTGISRW